VERVDRVDSVESRVRSVLTRSFVSAGALLLVLGACFVFHLRPGDPQLGEMSAERWRDVALPFLALVATFAGLARGIALPGEPHREPRVWTRPLLLAAPIPLLALALSIRDVHVSVLFLFAGPATIALAGCRASRRVEPLLAGIPLLALGLLLFGVEIFAGHSGEPPVRWGGPRTFATLFPRSEPFLGEGGRLRPNLHLHMASSERLRGATVRTNSWGFRNADEFGLVPAAEELRVLSLGDSFSIGMQIDQDAFLGPRLESELARAGGAPPVRVLNAEVSDPAYGLHYLQRHGLAFQPGVVLYGLCANDMLQAALRFGPDRLFDLDPEGTLVANPGAPPGPGVAAYGDVVYPAVSARALAGADPSAWERGIAAVERKLRWNARKLGGRLLRFELLRSLERDVVRTAPVPMFSYAGEAESADGHMRLLDGTANLAYFQVRTPAPVEEMYQKLFTLLRAMDRSVRAAGGRFVLVVHPQRFQVHAEDWRAIRDYWELDDADFDLEIYNDRLARFCRKSGLLCLDLLETFRLESKGRSLYLPRGDMHYNRRGHAVAARAIAGFFRANALEAPSSTRHAGLTYPPSP